MKLEIIRRYTGKTCVIGKFKVFDDDKLLLECFSFFKVFDKSDCRKKINLFYRYIFNSFF